MSSDQPTRAMPSTDDSESFWHLPPPEDEALKQLVGRELHIYRCQEILGRGGMGWVYLARHLHLERICALKVLSPRLVSQSERYLELFRDEGRAAAALVHPNIVTTHAIGKVEDLHFLEMEYVPGRTLRQILNDGPLTPQRALLLAVQIASGLALAHQQGILHRDLKLENVLLTARGVPKIADFGLARFVDEAPTGTEPLMGTPLYMAPELFSGQPPSTRSDVYALGVCLYRMIVGEMPYKARSIKELLHLYVHQPRPQARRIRPEIPLEIAECLELLLDPSPQNRPETGMDVLELLEAISGHLRDIEAIVHEALDDLKQVIWEGRNDRYQCLVRLPGGRAQKVFIEPASKGNQKLLSIFSLCAPAVLRYHERALRLNSEVAHGALAIRDIDGVPSYVMINTYPRATVDPLEIRRSVLEVAQFSDDFELEITGTDVH